MCTDKFINIPYIINLFPMDATKDADSADILLTMQNLITRMKCVPKDL